MKLENPFDTLNDLEEQSTETDKELVKKLTPEAAERTLNKRSWMDFLLKLSIVGVGGYTLYKVLTSKDERHKSLDRDRDNYSRHILPDRRDDNYSHAENNRHADYHRRDYNGRR